MKRDKRSVILPAWLLAAAFLFGGCAQSKYDNAVALMGQGAYAEAKVIFSELEEKDFLDSAAKAAECQTELDYAEAGALFAEGSYQDAREAFLILADFKDSAAKADECQTELDYAEADRQFAAGNYKYAREAFLVLAAFRDSASRVTYCDYNLALRAKDDKRLLDACEMFSALSGFEDADAELENCLLLLADETKSQVKNATSYYVDYGAITKYSDLLQRYRTELPQMAEWLDLLLSYPIDAEVRRDAEETIYSIYVYTTYIDTVYTILERSDSVSQDFIKALWPIWSENSARESLEVLSEFFIGLSAPNSAAKSIQMLYQRLDDDYAIAKNDRSAENWFGLLIDRTGSLTLNDTLSLAWLYQKLFPGSGIGESGKTISAPKDFLQTAGTAAAGKLMVYNAGTNRIEIGRLFTCDPSLVPKSIEEVGYVVETSDIQIKYTGQSYTYVTKGAREYKQVKVVQYPQGKVVRNVGEAVGPEPPFSFTYYGSPPVYKTGGPPSEEKVGDLVKKGVEYVLGLRR